MANILRRKTPPVPGNVKSLHYKARPVSDLSLWGRRCRLGIAQKGSTKKIHKRKNSNFCFTEKCFL